MARRTNAAHRSSRAARIESTAPAAARATARGQQHSRPCDVDVRLGISAGDVGPQADVGQVVPGKGPHHLPVGHVVLDERRVMEPRAEGAGMTDRIRDQGDQQDDERRPGGGKPAQPPALREDEERRCKERCEQPRTRVCVRQEGEGSTSGDAMHDAPAVRAPRIFQHEQQDDEDERLQGHLHGNPAELEQPGREPTQRNDRGRDADVTRSAEGQKSKQQNGRKDADRSKASSDSELGPVSRNTPCERVDEDGALVVAERLDVQRQHDHRARLAETPRSSTRCRRWKPRRDGSPADSTDRSTDGVRRPRGRHLPQAEVPAERATRATAAPPDSRARWSVGRATRHAILARADASACRVGFRERRPAACCG